PRSGRGDMFAALALVNTKYGSEFADLLNPTHHCKAGDFARLPLPKIDAEQIEPQAVDAIEIARNGWQTAETAPGFTAPPVALEPGTVSSWIERCRSLGQERTDALLGIEQRLQDAVGEALGEENEDSALVERSSITLFGNALYAFGNADNPEREAGR